MNAYLQETRLCDYSHPVIQEILHRAIDNLEGEVEIARGIYYCVRDGIKYAVGGSGLETKASRTVRVGYGDCGTKTNVHIALLRAAGIPARMRASKADALVIKDFLPIAMYKLFERSGKEDFHFWPECYISERWIACDALMDNKAYEGGIAKRAIYSG
jgi:transglutaminase-like putative cysteine protease